MQKSTILHTLKQLPNKFNLDDFLERLIVIEKIDEGMEEAKAGKTLSHDKVKKMVAKWHK
jgi:predicted transcriptional regulator